MNKKKLSHFALVSVVIPSYGSSNGLGRALDSIRNQTLLPLEVIIVSDGNGREVNDYIKDLVLDYADLNIKLLILTINVGAGEARNEGWRAAKGKFIAFLDSDDAWHPRKIELQYGFMKKNHNIDLVGHDYVLFNNNEDVIWPLLKDSITYHQISPWELFYQNQFITPSVMLKRELPINFANGQRYAEDYRLWLELSVCNKKIAKLDAPLACIFKPLISSRGLSSNLLKMEWGEIKAYVSACSLGGFYPLIILLIPFSILKFIRRITLRILNIRFKE